MFYNRVSRYKFALKNLWKLLTWPQGVKAGHWNNNRNLKTISKSFIDSSSSLEKCQQEHHLKAFFTTHDQVSPLSLSDFILKRQLIGSSDTEENEAPMYDWNPCVPCCRHFSKYRNLDFKIQSGIHTRRLQSVEADERIKAFDFNLLLATLMLFHKCSEQQLINNVFLRSIRGFWVSTGHVKVTNNFVIIAIQ